MVAVVWVMCVLVSVFSGATGTAERELWAWLHSEYRRQSTAAWCGVAWWSVGVSRVVVVMLWWCPLSCRESAFATSDVGKQCAP